MPWNPAQYNQFKEERYAPFYDALELVNKRKDMKVVDLGCGTGELTGKLAAALPGCNVLGVDASAEMLKESGAFTNDHLQFEQRTIEEQLSLSKKWDLVFSNAAIQWVDDHETLLPQLVSIIQPGGQLVVQMPSQNQNIANLLLIELVKEEPFASALNGYVRNFPVLSTQEYAMLLFTNGGKNITVFEKIYPVVVKDADGVYDFISGSALIPYTERLDEKMKAIFTAAYKKRLHRQFPSSPAFYPFKRIIFSAAF